MSGSPGSPQSIFRLLYCGLFYPSSRSVARNGSNPRCENALDTAAPSLARTSHHPSPDLSQRVKSDRGSLADDAEPAETAGAAATVAAAAAEETSTVAAAAGAAEAAAAGAAEMAAAGGAAPTAFGSTTWPVWHDWRLTLAKPRWVLDCLSSCSPPC